MLETAMGSGTENPGRLNVRGGDVKNIARKHGIAERRKTKRGERNDGKSERHDSTEEIGELRPGGVGGGLCQEVYEYLVG